MGKQKKSSGAAEGTFRGLSASKGRREALRCVANSGTEQKGRKSFSSRLFSASALSSSPEPQAFSWPFASPRG